MLRMLKGVTRSRVAGFSKYLVTLFMSAACLDAFSSNGQSFSGENHRVTAKAICILVFLPRGELVSS